MKPRPLLHSKTSTTIIFASKARLALSSRKALRKPPKPHTSKSTCWVFAGSTHPHYTTTHRHKKKSGRHILALLATSQPTAVFEPCFPHAPALLSAVLSASEGKSRLASARAYSKCEHLCTRSARAPDKLPPHTRSTPNTGLSLTPFPFILRPKIARTKTLWTSISRPNHRRGRARADSDVSPRHH